MRGKFEAILFLMLASVLVVLVSRVDSWIARVLTGVFLVVSATLFVLGLTGIPSPDHLEPGDGGEEGGVVEVGPGLSEERMERFWAELKGVVGRYREEPLAGIVVVAVDDFGQVSAHWWGPNDPGVTGPLLLGLEKIKSQILDRSFDLVLARTETPGESDE